MTTQVDQGHNPALQEKYYEQIKLLPRNPSKKPNREQNDGFQFHLIFLL